ncbi:hypothetical protein ACWC0A_37640 [Streptomyces scopuliridis]
MMSKEVARSAADADPALFDVDVDSLPSLQVEDLAGESAAELVARGAAYAREYDQIADQPTILLKNLAAVVVALRRQMGDWRGDTQAYRDRVSELYRMSGIPTDSRSRVQAAVRWHVGNLLRRAMTARELEGQGLLSTSPLERLRDSRSTNAALVRAVKVSAEVEKSTPKAKRSTGKDGKPTEESSGSPVKATADHIRLAGVASSIIGQLDSGVITKHMTAGQRAKLDGELEALQKKITALRKLTRKPPAKR